MRSNLNKTREVVYDSSKNSPPKETKKTIQHHPRQNKHHHDITRLTIPANIRKKTGLKDDRQKYQEGIDDFFLHPVVEIQMSFAQ
ncbi:MAG: hypothetical protein ACD_67C00067G0002 [uncultured bacterium]|nr:MAG: hypothetical protein ACD_67C00067G0002 [uncultured bacterium]